MKVYTKSEVYGKQLIDDTMGIQPWNEEFVARKAFQLNPGASMVRFDGFTFDHINSFIDVQVCISGQWINKRIYG